LDLALFDFDGTITTRETFPDFVRGAVPGWRVALATPPLAPLILAYRRGWLSGSVVRAAIVRAAFTSAPVAAYEAAGAAFARDAIPALLRPAAMARITWHQRRGDTVAVVSGNFDAVLAPWTAAHGVELLCSSLGRRGSRLTGGYAGAQCVGDEKARRVQGRWDLSSFARIHAYGDTAEDAAMLALADDAHCRKMPDVDDTMPAEAALCMPSTQVDRCGT